MFLLPTVSPEEAALHYPGYHSCKVPSGKQYLRLVKKDDVTAAVPEGYNEFLGFLSK